MGATVVMIPYGYCHCGCGQKTKISPKSHTEKGWVRGEPRRFLQGHRKTPPEERFWKFVNKTDGCWLWTGAKTHGYGRFGMPPGKVVMAHRFSYEQLVGPIPEGLTLDHLCRTPACVNPAHLEPVTNRENILRGTSPMAQQARQTTCKYGHELTYRGDGHRYCLTCARRWNAESRARRAEGKTKAQLKETAA